ncbi:hypothetical protein BDV96DRAFT_599865 [Lophiotrema nucula]|uniref:Uncharacterized protein n=1 Tax=Lophiotrema nucula TaxID=690887 RepID=A0A6A5Z9E6_9PLEO|nr:hypothetical protein BDV96DRAFT_599865 [Lophiotrema nucula]
MNRPPAVKPPRPRRTMEARATGEYGWAASNSMSPESLFPALEVGLCFPHMPAGSSVRAVEAGMIPLFKRSNASNDSQPSLQLLQLSSAVPLACRSDKHGTKGSARLLSASRLFAERATLLPLGVSSPTPWPPEPLPIRLLSADSGSWAVPATPSSSCTSPFTPWTPNRKLQISCDIRVISWGSGASKLQRSFWVPRNAGTRTSRSDHAGAAKFAMPAEVRGWIIARYMIRDLDIEAFVTRQRLAIPTALAALANAGSTPRPAFRLFSNISGQLTAVAAVPTISTPQSEGHKMPCVRQM